MGRFLGKPDLESFPNAAKKGMKIFTNQQIHAVSGYERLYRLFWNRKAEELCRSPSYAKWSKNAITGVIATEWSLKKTALLFNHATRLMDQEPGSGAKRKQKADTVHQGALSMLNEHKKSSSPWRGATKVKEAWQYEARQKEENSSYGRCNASKNYRA